MTTYEPNGIERRVLAYLDQRGGRADRYDLVRDLVSPDSRIGKGIMNGSNAGVPRIMGSWCRRLSKSGYVVQCSRRDGFYSHHEITDAGRRYFRESQS
jgi:hypothetical protein